MDNLVTQMADENRKLRNDNQALKYKLARLVGYVINMQDDHPDLIWPEFPDNYPDVWKFVA